MNGDYGYKSKRLLPIYPSSKMSIFALSALFTSIYAASAISAGTYTTTGRSCTNFTPSTCQVNCASVYSVSLSSDGSTNIFTPSTYSGCVCDIVTASNGQATGSHAGQFSVTSVSGGAQVSVGTSSSGCTLTYTTPQKSAAKSVVVAWPVVALVAAMM